MLRAFFLWGILAAAVAADELKLVQFSDIHSGGRYFSDQAFQSACREGLRLHPQGLLLTGDNGDNSYDQDHFYQRFRQDVGRWTEVVADYPGEVFLAPGNDDFGHNYQSQPEELRATAEAFREALGTRYYLNDLGNGLSASRLGGFRWITVNSQLFSPKNHTPEAPQQADATFQWLRGVLNQGTSPVVLMCHIPPSWDLYVGRPGWKPEYLRRLAELLDDYPSQVVIVCGHFHRNHIQGMRPQRPIPILTGGALATKYGYQPNWRDYRWQLEPGLGVKELSYTVHYPGHPLWSANYDLRPDRLQQFLDLISTNRSAYQHYMLDVYGHDKDWKKSTDDEAVRERIWNEFWVEPGAEEPSF